VRFQGWVLAGQAIFFTVAGAIYIVGGGSTSGFVMLVAAALFGLWTAVFLLGRRRRSDTDEASVVGRFPNGTTTAPLLAVAAVLLGNGLIIGLWMVIVGGIVMLGAVALYAFEYVSSERDDRASSE
jgi:predicted permease